MSLLSNLGNRLESLVIFRGLLRDPVIRACRRMLCAESLPQREKLSACGGIFLPAAGAWGGFFRLSAGADAQR